MKDGWRVENLSSVCQIKPPKNEAKKRFSNTDLVSFVPMSDLGINQKEKKQLGEVVGSYTYFADNDVLLEKITPCFENGKLGIARGLQNGIGFGSSEYIVFRSNGEIDSEYLFYILSQDSFRHAGAKEMSGAVGHKRVPKEFIENHSIPLSSVSEQKRIVAILDEAFAGIDAAIANTRKNLANARELFESYLNLVFRNTGNGWAKSTPGEVCKFQGGSQPPKSEFTYKWKEGCIRLIQIRDYKSDKHIVYIPKEKAKRFCNVSDIMIGRYGPPLFQILRGLEGAYNVALMKAIPNENLLTRDFLYYFLKNGDILRYIINASNRAAGQSGVNKTALEPYPITYPAKEGQTRIVSLLDNLNVDLQRLENIYQQKLNSLNELKQSLLLKAFSGELTEGDEPRKQAAVV